MRGYINALIRYALDKGLLERGDELFGGSARVVHFPVTGDKRFTHFSLQNGKDLVCRHTRS